MNEKITVFISKIVDVINIPLNLLLLFSNLIKLLTVKLNNLDWNESFTKKMTQ